MVIFGLKLTFMQRVVVMVVVLARLAGPHNVLDPGPFEKPTEPDET